MANRTAVSAWIYTTFREFLNTLCPEKKTSMWTKEKLDKKVPWHVSLMNILIISSQ